MNKTKRKRSAAELKATVALEEIKGEQILTKEAAKYSILPNMITS